MEKFKTIATTKEYCSALNNLPSKKKDPSNARETFQAMYDDVHVHNESLIDMYKNSDRDKGGYISIDYSEYENY